MAEELAGAHWMSTRLDQCTTGLTGLSGGLHFKPIAIRTTCPQMAEALFLRCAGGHPHEVVEGAATGPSAMYSPKLASLIARVVVPTTQQTPGGGFQQGGGSKKVGATREEDTPAPAKSAEEWAGEYLTSLHDNEWQSGGPEAALDLGNALLRATGTVSEAAKTLRQVGISVLGDHFEGLSDPKLDDLVDADLLAYARLVANKGISAGYVGDRRARVTAEPHASAKGHLREAMDRLWKDARRGRVLLCDDRSEEFLGGTLSVPLARVPKMNPDRTVSEKGRLVWDQRES